MGDGMETNARDSRKAGDGNTRNNEQPRHTVLPVIALSATEAMRMSRDYHDGPFAIISVMNPCEGRPYGYEVRHQAHFSRKNPQLLSVLRLRFGDFVGEREPDEYRTYPVRPDEAMTQEDATKVTEFVRTLPAGTMLVVHCSAGQSRSVGIAAAIDRAVNGRDAEWFEKTRWWHEPNPWCYRLTLEALGETFDGGQFKDRFYALSDALWERHVPMSMGLTWQSAVLMRRGWDDERTREVEKGTRPPAIASE